MNGANERGLVVPPGAGKTARGGSGAPTLIKATAEQTGGAFAAFEQATPPGSGPPLHIHHECDEALYVLEGTFTFRMGKDLITAPQGTLVLVPRGVSHTYVNSGVGTAKLLFWCVPAARMADYLAELAELPSASAEPGVAEGIALKHGVEIVGPPLSG